MKTLGRTESGGMRIEATAAEADAFRDFLEAVTGEPPLRLDMLGDLSGPIRLAAAQMRRLRKALTMRVPITVWAGMRGE